MVMINFLGTAQDGGTSQFGCACGNCSKALNKANFERKPKSLCKYGSFLF